MKDFSGCLFTLFLLVTFVIASAAFSILSTISAVWAIHETYYAFGAVLGDVTLQQLAGVLWPLFLLIGYVKFSLEYSVDEWKLSSSDRTYFYAERGKRLLINLVSQITAYLMWVYLLLPIAVDVFHWIW